MLLRRKVVFHVNHKANILEELGREAPSVARYAFLWRTILQHPCIYEILGDFGDQDYFHGDCLGQFAIAIREH